MTVFQAVFLGIIEGLTEFLPISSTAHLIFAGKFLGLRQTQFTTFFEVFIQSGAILAVVILYLKYLQNHKSLVLNLVISFIPTAIVGFVLHKVIKTVFFESESLILTTFFIVGCVFLLFEYLAKKGAIKPRRKINDMKAWEAVIVGFGQSLAVIPGVSRAGAVIVTMMGFDFNRSESALYSFLLAVPTIFAASVFDLIKTDISITTDPQKIMILSVGFMTSFLTALIVIKWFIGFLQKNTLVPFGIYRLILTILLWNQF